MDLLEKGSMIPDSLESVSLPSDLTVGELQLTHSTALSVCLPSCLKITLIHLCIWAYTCFSVHMPPWLAELFSLCTNELACVGMCIAMLTTVHMVPSGGSSQEPFSSSAYEARTSNSSHQAETSCLPYVWFYLTLMDSLTAPVTTLSLPLQAENTTVFIITFFIGLHMYVKHINLRKLTKNITLYKEKHQGGLSRQFRVKMPEPRLRTVT